MCPLTLRDWLSAGFCFGIGFGGALFVLVIALAIFGLIVASGTKR